MDAEEEAVIFQSESKNELVMFSVLNGSPTLAVPEEEVRRENGETKGVSLCTIAVFSVSPNTFQSIGSVTDLGLTLIREG